ncbi:MAG: tetratricopeptide repeat protein [Planctomycetota bacterium]
MRLKLVMIFTAVFFTFFSASISGASEAEKCVEAAERYLLEDKVSAAEKEIEKALKADPNHAPAHNLSGLISQSKGDNDAAEASFKKALECDAKFHIARLYLAELYTATDRLDEAAKELEKLIKENSKFTDAYAALARVHILQENYRKAVDILAKGKKTAGDTAEMEFLLGTAYIGLGPSRFDDSEKAFLESIRLKSDYVDSYVALADLYMEDGEYTKAAEKLVEALRHDGEHPEANYLYGRLSILRKQYARAMVALKKALEADPDNMDAHREIGLLYQDYKKDFAKAIFHYNKYKSLGGTDKRVEDWLGSAEEGEPSGTMEEEAEDEEEPEEDG